MLTEGQKTPKFVLLGDDGLEHSLEKYTGKWKILYFYPKDMTPGCTTEACEFNDSLSDALGDELVIFGISKDSVVSHTRFKSHYGLKFTLLSDPELQVHKLFGAFGEKKSYGRVSQGVIRSTFLVNPSNVITQVWKNVRAKGHAAQVMQAFTKVRAPAQMLQGKVTARRK